MALTIKLNVGGKFFETTKETLNGSGFFRKRMDDIIKSDTPYFIDRSYELFEHVLNFLRDNEYPYPSDYMNILELDYYDINGRVENKEKEKILNDKLDNIKFTMENYIQYIKKRKRFM